MKQPKKLKREYKLKLSKLGYNPNDYMLVSENESEIEVIHKETGERVRIER